MMQEISWELVSYGESGFTNPHDLVSPNPTQDGRGKFTHLGVQMEGLESRRHLNFTCSTTATTADGNPQFWFDHRPNQALSTNIIVLQTADLLPFIVEELEFDTSYYTRNNVRLVHSVHLINLPVEQGLSSLQPATLLHHSPMDYSLPQLLQSLGSSSGISQAHEVVCGLRLTGDSRQRIKLTSAVPANCCIMRLSEGGLTRFKAWGTKISGQLIANNNNNNNNNNAKPLLATSVFGCSDASYGDPKLVLRPRREGRIMAGWESCRHSARHRLGIRLNGPARITRLDVDTFMHCLNSFQFIAILAADASKTAEISDDQLIKLLPPWKVNNFDDERQIKQEFVEDNRLNDFIINANDRLLTESAFAGSANSLRYSLAVDNLERNSPWRLLLPMSRLQRDTLHTFTARNGLLVANFAASHLMLIGVPDGGIHRVAIWGISATIE